MSFSQSQQKFVSLMEEYTTFLEGMIGDEDQRFSALSEKNLQKIEHSISVAQANAKKLENYENQRMQLQQACGYGTKTFREIVGQSTENQQQLNILLQRFERAVDEIRFRNDKSMAVARDNMLLLDPQAVLPSQPGSKPSNPYDKMREEMNGLDGVLKTKV